MLRTNQVLPFGFIAGCAFLLLAICFVYLPGRADFQWIGGFVDDSFILLRYADHLKDGHGLVWNKGGPPTEGLSSIAWAGLIASISQFTNLPLTLTALYLGVIFAILSLPLVWVVAARSLAPSDQIYALLAPLLLVATPIFARHAISGMETVFVVFIYCLLMAAMMAPQAHSLGRVIATGIFCGLLYLVRPEAPLFGFLVPVVAYAFASASSTVRFNRQQLVTNASRLTLFLAAFGCVTVLVFCLRWTYFDTLWPLPAYMKLGVVRYDIGSQTTFILTQWTLFFSYAACLILPTMLWLSCRPQITAHQTGILIGLTAFLLYMLQVAPVMNFSHRYFAPMLGPIVVLLAIALPSLAYRLSPSRRGQALVISTYLLLAIIVSAGNMNAAKRDRDDRDTDRHLAQALSKAGNITLAFSEAGVIPFYSQQRFIDCAGLNEKFIAQNRYRKGFDRLYWPYVEKIYGLPDVHFDPLPECRGYASLDLLREDARQKYKAVHICSRKLHVLTSSSYYSSIMAALDAVSCPSSSD